MVSWRQHQGESVRNSLTRKDTEYHHFEEDLVHGTGEAPLKLEQTNKKWERPVENEIYSQSPHFFLNFADIAACRNVRKDVLQYSEIFNV